MRRRAIVGTLAAVMAATTGAGVASAAGDGDDRSALAEAQFRVYLLSNTELRPSDVTCTLPPTQNSDGEMLCFALVGRDSVAAVATLVEPGVYTFTAITKASAAAATAPQGSPTPAPGPAPEPGPGQESPANQAVVDAVAGLVQIGASIGEDLMDNNSSITSVEAITYDELTSTVSISLTTDITDDALRDFIAFDVTNVLAYLWEDDWPLRDPTATIQPRAEVIVDGEIYGTPFEVMVQVADYEIDFEGWLSITTGATTSGLKPAPEASLDAAARRIEVLRKGEHVDVRRSVFA